MGMRQLPFGARVSDSFVEMLKQASSKATAEWPGVLPCLCVEEKRHYETAGCGESREKRTDFEHGLEFVPTNRLALRRVPLMLVTERLWVVCFDTRKHAPQTTFKLDGLEVHVS